MASHRKEARKDRRIKYLEERLRESEDIAQVWMDKVTKEHNNFNKYRNALLAQHQADRDRMQQLQLEADRAREAARSYRMTMSIMANILGEENPETMREVFMDLVEEAVMMSPFIQCPNAPCDCWRSKATRRWMEKLQKVYSRRSVPLVRITDGQVDRDRTYDGEAGCGDE